MPEWQIQNRKYGQVMKTLLVTTPNREKPSTFPPIGVLSLIHYLRKGGQENVEFYNIDGNRPDYEEALNHIKAAAPDVLGISAVVSTAYGFTKRLADDVKKMLPDTLIVLGGNLAASAEIILRKTGVDLCVTGEGEVTFLNIVERRVQSSLNADYKDIKGLAYLDEQGMMVNTGYETALKSEDIYDLDWRDLEQASDINHFFYPAFDGDGNLIEDWVQHDPRAYEPHRREKRVATLPVAKGCVARCTFCHRFDKGLRHIPVDRVMANIQTMIERYNVGFIRIGAETFGADKRWLEDFCEQIAPYDVLWQAAGIRTNSVSPEWIARMKEVGCASLIFGNETGSERMLQIMEKKVLLEDNYSAMNWTIDAGLYTGIQLVVGMPGETSETVGETIEYCKHVSTRNELQDPNNLSINYAQALPGTPLYEYGRHKGLIGSGLDEEEQYLLDISDRDAHDETTTLNYTDTPTLICRTWRPRITIEVNYAYVQKFGLNHYLKGVLKLAGGFVENRAASGYWANPKRLTEMSYEDNGQSEEKSAYSAAEVPSLFRLLRHGQFGLAIVCHPVFFYRAKSILPILVLLNLTRIKGVRFGFSVLVDYLSSVIGFSKLVKKSPVTYKSLRKIVDDDLGILDGDNANMIQLRKGR
jgi:anaerobic magnesium-protoporphyrin IX monomethyl ester cyclase